MASLASDLATQGLRRHIDVDGLVPEELRRAATTRTLHDCSKAETPKESSGSTGSWSGPTTSRFPARPVPVLCGGSPAVRADTYRGGARDSRTRDPRRRGHRAGLSLVQLRRSLHSRAACDGLASGQELLQGSDAEAGKHTPRAGDGELHPGGQVSTQRHQRTFAVPCFSVSLRVRDEFPNAIVELVDALLTSYGDLEIRVILDRNYPDPAFLERAFTAEPRVSLVDATDDEHSPSRAPSLSGGPRGHPRLGHLPRDSRADDGRAPRCAPPHGARKSHPLGTTIDVLSTGTAARA